jgi:DeoR family transcriptional regulator, aga operon transcriptional repressor
MDTTSTLSNLERQQKLIRLLDRQGRLSIAQVCSEFDISEATARRDLEALAQQGLLQRVHGGAIPVRKATPEQPILERSHEQSDEKAQIGRAAAALIDDGDTVFLGSGTTVLEVARLIDSRPLTVITNSLPVINLLSQKPNINLISLGGMLRDSELSFIGHITEQAMGELRADKVIIGTHGISLVHGLTNDYLPETQTDRAILKIGKQVIVVADHTKWGAISTVFLADLSNVHTLVTDNRTEPEMIAAMREHGVVVVIG